MNSNQNIIVPQDQVSDENPDEKVDLTGLEDPDDTSKTLTFQDSEELQTTFITYLLHDSEVLGKANDLGLKPDYFVNLVHKSIASICLNFWRKYQEAPHKDIVDAEIDAKFKDKKNYTFVKVTLSVARMKWLPRLYPKQYVIDKLATFAKQMAAIQLSQKLLEANQTVSKIEQAHKDYIQAYAKIQENQGHGSTDWQLYSPDDIEAMPGIEWQIDGHFPRRATVTIFGDSGAGKSFYAIDMACSIATGTPFLGKWNTIKGRVLYILSEGSYGLKGRLRAWKKAKGIDRLENIVFSTVSHNLQDRAEVDKLIQRAIDKLGGIDVVFVDTLSRNFGGGDTDKNAEMQAYLGNVDYIRERTGATVANVHHTGWGDAKRERGAKSLRDYSDASICIVKSGKNWIQVICKKQKDAAEFENYRLEKVKSEGSLYLAFTEEEEGEDEIDLLPEIPYLPPGTEPTGKNTRTISDLIEKTHLKKKTVERRLKKYEASNLVDRKKLVDLPTEPFRYWRIIEDTTE